MAGYYLTTPTNRVVSPPRIGPKAGSRPSNRATGPEDFMNDDDLDGIGAAVGVIAAIILAYIVYTVVVVL